MTLSTPQSSTRCSSPSEMLPTMTATSFSPLASQSLRVSEHSSSETGSTLSPSRSMKTHISL